MKMSKRFVAVLLCVLAIGMLLPIQVLAAGSIELNGDASLTITESYNDAGLSGVTFEIYLVSTVDETGELTPVDTFQAYSDGLDIRGKNDEAWKSMAETLEREIVLGSFGDIQPTDSAVTDESGTVRFPTSGKRLTMGLYLVLGTRVEKDGYVYSTAPFFALIPEQDLDDNVWNYAVNANAKPSESPVVADFEVIKIWDDDCHKDQRPESITIQLMQDGQAYGDPVTLPCDGAWKYTWRDLDVNHKWTVTEKQVEGYQDPDIKQDGNTFVVTNTCNKPIATTPTQPQGPSLPQTGQLWWPVPVLIAAGLLFVVMGIMRRRGAAHEE